MDIQFVEPLWGAVKRMGETLNPLSAIITVSSLVVATTAVPVSRWLSRSQIRFFNNDFKVLNNFSEVWKKMSVLMEAGSKRGDQIEVRNIGLDLEIVLPNLYNFIDRQTKTAIGLRLNYKGLVVNPGSPYITDLIDDCKPPDDGKSPDGRESNIRSAQVEVTMAKVKTDFARAFASYPMIKVQVFSYDVPIVIHGVLITISNETNCNKHLMLGFTELTTKGKMRGSDKPYLYLKYKQGKPQSEATKHYFTFFEEWFEYYFMQRKEPALVNRAPHLSLLDQR